jgi:hypothetical protein
MKLLPPFGAELSIDPTLRENGLTHSLGTYSVNPVRSGSVLDSLRVSQPRPRRGLLNMYLGLKNLRDMQTVGLDSDQAASQNDVP